MPEHPSHDMAVRLDAADPLRSFRARFFLPPGKNRAETIYLCGNSLGLQPKTARQAIETELDDWRDLGVEGHFNAKHPWMPYHEFVTEPLARIVGAQAVEVVAMNSLTVNLHLMLVSFYRPTPERYRIAIEAKAFPSDQYAVDSQTRFHGFDPARAVLEFTPREGEELIRTEDILEEIDRHGHEIAVVMLGGVNYYTGQLFALREIAAAAHAKGCIVGYDLAHAAGNVPLDLHDWGVDFAVWCSYKYLNAGPGGIAGAFVHEKHQSDSSLPRFAGWWGHDKKTRFRMGPEFSQIPGAEGWQLSNPPIFQLAALRASLAEFDQGGMAALRQKSVLLTGFLESALEDLRALGVRIITPSSPSERGAQLSIQVQGRGREVFDALQKRDVICDWREPDVIRVAPVPLYNSFADAWAFRQALGEILERDE